VALRDFELSTSELDTRATAGKSAAGGPDPVVTTGQRLPTGIGELASTPYMKRNAGDPLVLPRG
jgi:hypothetical protein